MKARSLLCLLLLFQSLTMAGCTQAVLSSAEVEALPSNGIGCQANVGAYHLPRRLITPVISGNSSQYKLSVTPGPVIADEETYCLDFLFSGWSEDRIGVQRESNLLLKRVSTSLDDRSKDVAYASIQATANLIAFAQAQSLKRGTTTGAGAQQTLASIPFDPFDRQQVQEVNINLRRFGYCVYLDSSDDPYVPAWSSPDICNRPGGVYPKSMVSETATRYRQGRALQQRGIVYQPELSHRLIVLRKRDPDNSREAWHLAATEYVTMPNDAPMFALGVNRALFVKSTTDITFDHGVLANVSVKRPSELNALVDIPVYAAQVALSIPAATLEIFQNEANNRKELWQTHAELIKTLRNLKNDKLRDQVIADGGIPQSPVDLVSLGRSTSDAGLANTQIAHEACLQNADLIGTESAAQLCNEYMGTP